MAYSPELEQEVKSPEYQGLSYSEVLTKLKEQTYPALGAIGGDNLRDVVTLLCGGIAYRIKQDPNNPVSVMLATAFDKMTMNAFQFNFAAPEVVQMLNLGVSAGFILEEERDKFNQLATQQKPVWPDVSIYDLVQCLDPYQISLNTWVETGEVEPIARQGMLQLVAALPEQDFLILEMSVSPNGSMWGDYVQVNVLTQILNPDYYVITLPSKGNLKRRFRWKGGKYKLNGIMTIS